MKKRNSILVIAIPFLIILATTIIYEYGSSRIQASNEALAEVLNIKMKTLDKYVSLIAQQPQFEQRSAALKEMRKDQASKVMVGQTGSLATATLQGTVRTVITGKGGSIFSERVEKAEDLEQMRVISISVDATVPNTKVLGDILYSLETQTPYLVVKELDSRIANYTNPKDLIVKIKIAALTMRH